MTRKRGPNTRAGKIQSKPLSYGQGGDCLFKEPDKAYDENSATRKRGTKHTRSPETSKAETLSIPYLRAVTLDLEPDACTGALAVRHAVDPDPPCLPPAAVNEGVEIPGPTPIVSRRDMLPAVLDVPAPVVLELALSERWMGGRERLLPPVLLVLVVVGAAVAVVGGTGREEEEEAEDAAEALVVVGGGWACLGPGPWVSPRLTETGVIGHGSAAVNVWSSQ